MEYKWKITIENNYPHRGWNYWQYNLHAKGFAVKDHWVERGPYYGTGMWPDKKEVTLLANTESVVGPKTLEIFIGFFHHQEGLKKSQRVTFTVKSDGFFSNWQYYCNGDFMGESFYDNKSFEIFLIVKEDGEMEIVRIDKSS